MTFYDVLKEECAKKRTSPSALVEKLGMSKSNVYRWKRGKSSPRFEVIAEIAKELGCSTTTLVRKMERE